MPDGWLLDTYGSKTVYAFSIIIWSAFTIMHGWIGFFSAGTAVVALFAPCFLVALAESPALPADARVVAA